MKFPIDCSTVNLPLEELVFIIQTEDAATDSFLAKSTKPVAPVRYCIRGSKAAVVVVDRSIPNREG